MLEIVDHAYSEREIQKMEVQVLSVLKWVQPFNIAFTHISLACIIYFGVMYVSRFDLGRPLPLHFLRRASKAGGVDSATHTLAKY